MRKTIKNQKRTMTRKNIPDQESIQGVGCLQKDESYLQVTKQFEILFDKGLFEQAWEEIDRLEKAGSLRLFSVRNFRGILCSALERFEAARVYFNEAEQLAENDEDKSAVFNNLTGMAIDQKEYHVGLKWAKKTLSLLPNQSIAWVNLLICIGQIGSEQEIAAALSTMLNVCDLSQQTLLEKYLRHGQLLESVRSHPYFISNVLPLLQKGDD